MIKILVKKSVRQVEKERRRPAAEIQDEINLQVRQWGIDVQKVELSEPKVLKQPENGGNSAVGSILKGLGMKSDPKYPTPEEFGLNRNEEGNIIEPRSLVPVSTTDGNSSPLPSFGFVLFF